MSLIQNIFGNATEANLEELQREFEPIIIEDEQIVAAYKIFRDKWVFTTKRLIMLNVQGVTGSKREYHSVPYSSITHFSIETGGTFDGDCEMKLWIRGASVPIEKEFKKGTDLKGLQRILAKYILK
ncbi:MAG: PH domain-containing protein [Rikenellaceae bacterium]|mgnify:CR=1 FL=1|nr:PH domain-containing protein [Rikenellaceae bacterium]MBQ3535328.1 PH domain-containing protein [Alistipes sp.]MBQ8543888.1 PH domain-containing protein [Alistipes sp.]MBR3703249.1 PH domain-containing protein [Alistipes sp.]